MPRKKVILVLGAGIGGLRVVQRLQKRLPKTHEIVLVDKSPVHIFSPDLYQVATVFSKKITDSCLARIKETVATPISRLVDPWRVTFIQAEVTGLDPNKRKVFLNVGAPLTYDTLVVALGSVSNYFNVPGVKEYAYPLKTVTDALAINCQVDHLFFERYQTKSNEPVVITIAGGGATGVELAGEMMGMLHKLCKKYHHDPKKISIQLVQSGSLLGGFDEKGSALIREELSQIGIDLYMGHRVSELKRGKVEVIRQSDEEVIHLPCDILIWTCGVKVNPVVSDALGDPKLNGAIPVSQSLQLRDHSNIFALGDCAAIRKSEHSHEWVPWSAQHAAQEADLVAGNILRRLKRRPMKQFRMGLALFVVPVGFHLTLFQIEHWIFHNAFTRFLKSMVTLKYALSILPVGRAWEKFCLGEEIWEQNDED